MSAAVNAVKRVLQAAPKGVRSFQTSAARMGGGHADEPAYIHAKHMYDLPNMKNRKLKIGAGIIGVVSAGYLIPFVAVKFNQSKMG